MGNLLLNIQRMKVDRFICIDPGAGGGIALFRVGQSPEASCFKMLEVKVFSAFLNQQKECAELKRGQLIVMIEHQQVFKSDSDDGRQFGMQKLLQNFAQLKAACEICGVKYFTCMPISWQSGLGMKRIKNESKTDRKNRYKAKASEYFPYVKITLQTADALCMLKFLETKLRFDSEWVTSKLK